MGDSITDASWASTPAAGMFLVQWPQILKAWGFTKTAGRIHAYLLTEGEARNQDEIMGALDISRGGTSTQTAILLEAGLVERIRILGERSDRYRPIVDAAAIFHALRAQHIAQTLRPLQEMNDSLTAIANRRDLQWLEPVHDLGNELINGIFFDTTTH